MSNGPGETLAVAVPTIVALESLLKRAEDLQIQCGKGRLRTKEVRELLSELDRMAHQVIQAAEDGLFRLFDRRRREHTDLLKETVSGYVDASDCVHFGYRAETLRQVIEEYSPGYLQGNVGAGSTVAAAHAATAADRPNAAREIGEAQRDLARRPEPDCTGAVQHAMAALEAVARDVTGDEKATLGDILKAKPALFPRPLDVVMGKIWGYASEMARHVHEGDRLEVEEVELLVALAAAGVTYLVKKSKS